MSIPTSLPPPSTQLLRQCCNHQISQPAPPNCRPHTTSETAHYQSQVMEINSSFSAVKDSVDSLIGYIKTFINVSSSKLNPNVRDGLLSESVLSQSDLIQDVEADVHVSADHVQNSYIIIQDNIPGETHNLNESIASNEEFMPSPSKADGSLNSYVPTNQLSKLMQ